jgi:fructose-1,6-bisphosphatase
MAFIIGQAGGIATDGKEEIPSLRIEDLEQRRSACTGSRFELQKAMVFLS